MSLSMYYHSDSEVTMELYLQNIDFTLQELQNGSLNTG